MTSATVDAWIFLFYLVLLALAVVADLRDTIWFVPLALSVVCAILWFVSAPGNSGRVARRRRRIS